MTNEQKAPAAMKMFRYKNVSTVALQVPELNMTVPKDGYSSPMPDGTPTLDAYVTGHLMVREALDIPEMPNNEIKGIVQGGAVTETNTQGPVATIHAGPGQAAPAVAPAPAPKTPAATATANLEYVPLKTSTPEEKVAAYDNSAVVKTAIANTVISVGTDLAGFNQHGEIPADEAARLVRSAGASSFSTEVNTGNYIADEAQKIIVSAAGVVSTPPQNYAIPEGVPADLAPFFKQSGLQKKIFTYKTANADVLIKLKSFEKDPNVLSCIDQRLAELGR